MTQTLWELTDIHVWIKDNDGIVIFSEWRNDTEMYYEGEWVTGEKTLLWPRRSTVLHA
jgi:hypothetical protein